MPLTLRVFEFHKALSFWQGFVRLLLFLECFHILPLEQDFEEDE